ncbi:MAG TPA: hypothetical protein VGK20_08020 [Candidatus Binatia bacterium]|jgi:hypothetical protein
MSEQHDPHSSGNEDVRFEATDVSTRPVVISVLALAFFTVFFTFAADRTFRMLAAHQEAVSPPASPLAAEYAAKQPPEPRLQLDPKSDLEKLHAYENGELGKYGWIDKDKGIAQIPIARAKELLLAKGLPARQGPVPFKMTTPSTVAPSQMKEGSGAPDWQHGNSGEGHEGAAAEAHEHG